MRLARPIIGTWMLAGGFFGFISGIAFGATLLTGALIGVGLGIVGGLLLGILIVIMHRRAVGRLTSEITEAALGAEHTRTVYVLLPYMRAYELTQQMLRLMLTAKPTLSDVERGELAAEIMIPSGAREFWTSLVNMRLSPIDESRTQIVVECRPKYDVFDATPPALPDFGRNLDVVQRIARFLESVSDAFRPES